MTKLTTIPVADVELLLKKIAFDVNTLTVGDVGQAQALLAKINPPDPSLLEMIYKERNKAGMSDTLREFWRRLEEKACSLDLERGSHHKEAERLRALSNRYHQALTEISNHTPEAYVSWSGAYDKVRKMASKALDF